MFFENNSVDVGMMSLLVISHSCDSPTPSWPCTNHSSFFIVGAPTMKALMMNGFYCGVCCFVLLIPTPEEYRVPRVNPGVTASKLFPPLLPSLATPGPPLPYRPLQNIPVLLSEVQSGVQHLLGLISGLRRGGRGIPISSLVVEMDRLLSRRLRLSNSCPSSPVPVG